MVVEIVSPDDVSWQKLPFYASHHVDEVLIVDPAKRVVHWLALQDGEYRAVERSEMIELGARRCRGADPLALKGRPRKPQPLP